MRLQPVLILFLVLALCANTSALELRVKDLAQIDDGGSHKLIGYGLVVGLQGTGDGKKALFTIQSLANMLEEFGVSVEPDQLQVDNVAGVIVTAELPPQTKSGATLDVTVSSMGDSESLQGGMLLLTPLRAADGKVYAIAQGPVSIGGYNAGQGNSNVRKNHSAVGRVPNGASIVRAITADLMNPLGEGSYLSLQLNQPDFTTAQRVAESINRGFADGRAQAVSASLVQVCVDLKSTSVLEAITAIENLCVVPDMPARVVINERTGTVIISSNVRILPVAIAHGGLTVKAQREFLVSQPNPLVYESEHGNITQQVGNLNSTAVAAESASGNEAGAEQISGEDVIVVPPVRGGETVVVPEDRVEVEEMQKQLVAVGGEANLGDLVEGLNALGVSPRDLIAIIQALKEAGALQAELVIQ